MTFEYLDTKQRKSPLNSSWLRPRQPLEIFLYSFTKHIIFHSYPLFPIFWSLLAKNNFPQHIVWSNLFQKLSFCFIWYYFWVGISDNCGPKRLKIDLPYYSVYRYITNGASWIFQVEIFFFIFLLLKKYLW